MRFTRPHAVAIAVVLSATSCLIPGAIAESPPADAANTVGQEARAQELAALKSRIRRLESELNTVRGRRDSAREELSAVDRAIGQKVLELRRLDRRYDNDQRRIRQLQQRAKSESRVLAGERKALAEQARATFMLGQQEYLKVLLNQQDPAHAARTLIYYRYFTDARLGRINAIRDKLAELAALEQDITRHSEALLRLRREQEDAKTLLDGAQAKRRTLLGSLEREVSDRAQAIERLREDQARLERLLRELQQHLPAMPEALPTKGKFAQYRGRLPLPVAGRLGANFGEPKGLGRLKWRGILVESPEGRDVRAVFRGRVAYSDWLRGFGLLLILDHGDGYMTLYGHNQSLYKDIGEWVEAGEVVAAVGATGDSPAPGVYFEVRHNGIPRDPLQWCSRREGGQTARGRGRPR